MHEDRETLRGIRFSASCLYVFGMIVALQAAAFAFLLAGSVAMRKQSVHLSEVVSTLGTIVACGLLAYICIRASKALHQEQSWAIYVADVIGVLVSALVWLLISDIRHPEKQSADEYFLFPLILRWEHLFYGGLLIAVCLMFGRASEPKKVINNEG